MKIIKILIKLFFQFISIILTNQNTFHFNSPNLNLGLNNKIISNNIDLQVNCIQNNILQIKFTDKDSPRFELPQKDPFPYHKNFDNPCISQMNYFTDTNPLSIQVTRKLTDVSQ